MKCRLCLIECLHDKSISLFTNDEESDLTKLIAKYLYIEITQLDAFSTVMCKDCVQHLNEFHKFFQHVEEQQQLLQNEFLEVKCVVGERPLNSLLNVEDTPSNLEDNDESIMDVKEFINDDDSCIDRSTLMDEFGYAGDYLVSGNESNVESDDDDDDVPLQRLLTKSKSIKSETVNGKSTKSTPKKRGRKKNFQSEKLVKRKYESKKATREIENEDSLEKKDEDKSRKSKYSITPEESKIRDDMVAKYVNLKCEICGTQVDTYDNLKIHFRKEHNTKAYITCCGKKFLRRFLLLDHIQCHLNPDHFKCSLCEKVLKSRSSLILHNANMHQDREVMKNACHICGKRFKHPSNLNSHMAVHAEVRNYICEFCEKGFKSNLLLKMHIQNLHSERTPYICETCGKEYRFKLSFERHVAEHQGQTVEPNYQCKVCGQWYTQYNLRRHMKRHIVENVDCEICGKSFKSKAALTSHISGCHQKREKNYICTFCGKTFERPRYLKEHVDMHTGQKEYKCKYCVREFRSKANMYAHVKKIHTEQWAEAKSARFRNMECKAESLKLASGPS